VPRLKKTDSKGTFTYLRNGEEATDDVLSDGSGAYVPGISRHDSSGTKFFHDDFLGTHKANSSQSVTGTRSYDAFGNLTGTMGAPTQPFGFAGSWGYQEDPAQAGWNWWSYTGALRPWRDLGRRSDFRGASIVWSGKGPPRDAREPLTLTP
jgi:hypothetical protein